MSEFEEYIKNKYPSDYLLMTVRYPDQELCELYSDQFEVWRHQQTEINQLKTQLAVYKEDMQKDAEKIGGLQKRIDGVSQVLCELKESMEGFKEMDLYDKGYRATTEYVIADLEQALRGAND